MSEIIKIKLNNIRPYNIIKIFNDTFSETYEYVGCNYNAETKECIYHLLKKNKEN